MTKEMRARRKTPLSREQKELIPKLQAWGHKVLVYSVREVLDVLAGYGVLPRAGVTLQ